MKKIKKFLNEYWIVIVSFIFNLLFFFLPLPYIVEGTGGLISIKDRFEIDGKVSNDYYMAYVSSYRGTPASLIYAFFKKGYDIEKITKKEQKLDDTINKFLLTSSSNDSAIYAYTKANKEVSYDDPYLDVLLVDENALTNIEVGDRIYGIEDVEFTDLDLVLNDVSSIVDSKNVGDKVKVYVLNNGNKYERYATVYIHEKEKIIGIGGVVSCNIKTDPEIKYSFDKKESGPSGGFMLSLAIYDVLVKEDISRGLKIAGTGTIDLNGNVGVIGGVSYKIRGAKKEGVDVFFVPADNYDEANKVCVDEGCNFDLVKVSTFDDALEYLKSYN